MTTKTGSDACFSFLLKTDEPAYTETRKDVYAAMKNFSLYLFALLLCVGIVPLAPKVFPPEAEETPELIHLLNSQTGEVTAIPLEDYVIGVLTSANYPCRGEALKAVAVAIRSCARYCETKHPVHKDAAICDDPACCAAFSTDAFSEWAVEAAAETAGLIVIYKGEPAATLTFESAGKHTASSFSVYGVTIPYLAGVENVAEDCVTETDMSEKDFLSAIGAPEGASVADLFLGRDASGRVCGAEFTGASWYMTGDELAEALSLPSCFFTLKARNGIVTAQCEGAGHGVGMSRNGASLLAESGKDFREILIFYFPGTEIRHH